MLNINWVQGQPDWVANRLSPKKYFPPSPHSAEFRLENLGNPWHPGMIHIPGVQGIEIGSGIITPALGRGLYARIGIAFPFTTECLRFVKGKAIWNDTFNTWDFPLKSQESKSFLKEVLVLVDEFFWSVPVSGIVEIHWRLKLSEKNTKVLSRHFQQKQDKWFDLVPQWLEDIADVFVVPSLTEDRIRQETLRYLQSRFKESKSICSNLACLSFVRHKYTSYDRLTKVNSSAYKEINTAIAKQYPWLEDVALAANYVRYKNA